MAKKRTTQRTEETQRQTRKDLLVARRQAQQTRQIRLAMGGVAGLLVLLFLVAIVNELFISPGRSVAVVNGEEISLREWQQRVRYERAQRIIVLENQLEAFGGDVGIIQQFAGQMIIELQDAESLAQNVLDQMINEKVAMQLAEARGITVTSADVDEAIGGVFNYFGGESPTPLPLPTETTVPTPSITPMAAADDEAQVPAETPAAGPTSTPRPTATPVSEEAYQEQYGDLLGQFDDLGVDESSYRAVIRAQLYQERLMDVLADEFTLPQEAEHASLFYISYDEEQEALDAVARLSEDFLRNWNLIRSAAADDPLPGTASELLWRTQEDLAAVLGEEVAAAAFDLSVGETSQVLTRVLDPENSRYYVIQVSGREMRPLTENAYEQKKFELLTSTIDSQLAGNLESTEFWRNRIPTDPVLDAKFLAPPTATPPQPGEGQGQDVIPVLPTPSEGS